MNTNFGVIDIVFDDLVLVQPTTVPVMKGLREVPMVQRLANCIKTNSHHIQEKSTDHVGGYTIFQEFLRKIPIECHALGIHLVVPPALGDHTRPREGEPICVDTIGFEECDVFFPAVVRVCGNVARGSIGDLARNAGECIPYRVGTTTLVVRAFNLVARYG